MSQDKMTPHDELMALAGKWDLRSDPHSGKCAADLRALLDSDAFRAMVRDAEAQGAYRLLSEGETIHEADEHLADDASTWRVVGRQLVTGLPYRPGFYMPMRRRTDAAIDAAASGAGES